jgi:hypothetical protein
VIEIIEFGSDGFVDPFKFYVILNEFKIEAEVWYVAGHACSAKRR